MLSVTALGPPQVWQRYLWQSAGSRPAHRRLLLSGATGLLVGKGWTLCGGLPTHIALRYERQGTAWLRRDASGQPTRAYPCQLSFDFLKGYK